MHLTAPLPTVPDLAEEEDEPVGRHPLEPGRETKSLLNLTEGQKVGAGSGARPFLGDAVSCSNPCQLPAARLAVPEKAPRSNLAFGM